MRAALETEEDFEQMMQTLTRLQVTQVDLQPDYYL
jgi:hypothetical protein